MSGTQRTTLRSEGGQAMVESAIVIPMYVFLILGLLQFALINQARLMTKYAAYKAVRAGALHSADPKAMRDAALWALLPLVATGMPHRDGTGSLVSKTNSVTNYGKKWLIVKGLGGWIVPGTLRYAEVATCGPTQADLKWDTDEIDFDDPKVWSVHVTRRNNTAWKKSERTKLRVQVTYNYRMPIPFANMILADIALGQQISEALFLGKNPTMLTSLKKAASKLNVLRLMGIYVWPIRASYSMRMQSNLYKKNLPKKNGKDINGQCTARWL